MSRAAVSRATMRRIVRVLVIFALPGCGLILDPEPPSPGGPRAEQLECLVTVRNPEGMEVVVSSVTHEDFLNERQYFTCSGSSCPTTCSRSTVAGAEADWRIWARRRIEVVGADPTSTSTFRLAEGPWCEVPGTLRCETRDRLVSVPPCDDIVGPDLCTAAPVVGDPCIEVSCPAPGCSSIDFGNILISDMPGSGGVRQTVSVSNCGTVDVRTRIDQVVLPLGPRGQFTIPNDAFDCGPRSPDEMMFGRLLQSPPGDSECSFDVEFLPTMPLEHTAQKVFWSEALPDHTIALRGFGVGGGLIDDAPVTMCLAEMLPCSAQETITLTNGGPGPVVVRSIMTSETNFRVTPGPGMLPITLNPGDPPLEVRVQWCAGPPGALSGVLSIDTTARRLAVDLETRPSCP